MNFINEESDFLNLFKNCKPNKTVLNTFRYLFYKFSKGIYVEIKNNKIDKFIVFKNKNYTNDWSHLIVEKNNLDSEDKVKEFILNSVVRFYYNNWNVTKPYEQYLNECRKKFDWSKYETDVSKWYANNGIFRFDKMTKEPKHTEFVYSVLQNLCSHRKIKNSKFFINTRDSPIQAKNFQEPYFQIFGKGVKINSVYRNKMTKIFSFSTDKQYYKDLLFPTFSDKIACTNNYNTDWKSKLNKAVFRGSTTGFSTNNQRIQLYNLCKKMNDDFIDFKFTKLQNRPRIENGYLQFINEKDVAVYKDSYLSPKEQSNYKFVIHVAGNVEAFRLSFELAFESCIIFIENNWSIWYKELLIPNVHYIPVKSDLSDFKQVIEWVKTHDSDCEEIAKKSKSFYEEILKLDKEFLDNLEKQINL